MSKEIIRFRGLSFNRDEQAVGNGELSLCAGVELHDGTLRPSVLKGTKVCDNLVTGENGEDTGQISMMHGINTVEVWTIDVTIRKGGGGETATLLYVHETASYRHLIGQVVRQVDGREYSSIYWFDKDGTPGGIEHPVSYYRELMSDAEYNEFLVEFGRPESGITDFVYKNLSDGHDVIYETNESWVEQKAIHTFSEGDEIISIDSVGNTLIVMTNSAIHYILWKDNDYKYLGTEIPFVDISFRPSEDYKAAFDRSTIQNTNYDQEVYTAWRQINVDPRDILEVSNSAQSVNVKGEYRTLMTESVWALINQANNTVAKDGHFYAPFLIRYCYRLYDGSMVMHSAPVFMNVSLPQSYRVYSANVVKVLSEENKGSAPSYISDPGIAVGSMGILNVGTYITDENGHEFRVENTVLFYRPNNIGIRYCLGKAYGNEERLESLKSDWGDIVKSIDIFVSPMMTREKSGEQIDKFVPQAENHYGIREVVGSGVRRQFVTSLTGAYYTLYQDGPYTTYYKKHNHESCILADIPMMSKDEYLQKLKDCSTFYKLTSFNLETDDVTADPLYRDLKYDKTIVPNISAQELMKDDYHTHHVLVPLKEEHGMYVYNHRLNLYGMKEKLFSGFDIGTMLNNYSQDISDDIMDTINVSEVVVELKTDDGTKYVKKNCHSVVYPFPSICQTLFFYPDSRAVKMTLYFSGQYQDKKLEIPLENCNFLNGAVGSPLFYDKTFVPIVAGDMPSVNDEVPMINKVITSGADNPYYFPLEGRNTVGVGRIRGIAAVTRALSQGQVGDHDLVVFSTDGIWVMKVSSTGTYMTTHNISREVCSNVRSICQLDQSIVFATQRNLSKFVESDVVSISDILDGPIPKFAPVADSMLPTLTQYFANNADITKLLGFGTPAVDMFNNGRVFYDYASSRIVVLQQNTSQESVALVFSIRDQAWSTMKVPGIRAVIPGYPSPYVQTVDGKVMVLDKQYDYTGSTRSGGLIITRTLTFSDTMDVLRGFRQYTDSAQMPLMFFFGSNDQRNWKPIGQTEREFYEYMPGHPYRFFRIAIYMQLLPSEEYQQLELEIINKYAKL